MKTIIYYYSATGNSLYVTRFLAERLPEAELRSIPEELANGRHESSASCARADTRPSLAVGRFEAQADRIGFVFPLHYLSLPLQVEELAERLSLKESPYLFAIATCGVPYWGRPFLDMDEILARKGRKLHGAWFLRLVSNYLPLRDTAAEWRIGIRAWLAERKLQGIAKAIENKEHHITWQLFRDMCRRYHEEWRQKAGTIDEDFSCDRARCTACGLCERICPRQNIQRPEGHPIWQHNCVECLGCLHICPTEAIDYGGVTKGRRRYRHKDIKAADLLHDFSKDGNL